MQSTYLNDLKSLSYPFIQDPPFPDSCILQISVCLRKPAFDKVLVTSVIVQDGSVSVALVGQRGVTQTDIGTITATVTSNHSGVLDPADDILAFGYMFIGDILQSAVGSYTGLFQLQPSCVVYMPDNVYGKLSTIKVNNIHTKTASHLQLNVTGSIQEQNAGLSAIQQTAANEFVHRDDQLAFQGVSGLNSVPFDSADFQRTLIVQPDESGITAKISGDLRQPSSSQPTPQQRMQVAGGVVQVALLGGTSFPNCYGDKDQAAMTE